MILCVAGCELNSDWMTAMTPAPKPSTINCSAMDVKLRSDGFGERIYLVYLYVYVPTSPPQKKRVIEGHQARTSIPGTYLNHKALRKLYSICFFNVTVSYKSCDADKFKIRCLHQKFSIARNCIIIICEHVEYFHLPELVSEETERSEA